MADEDQQLQGKRKGGMMKLIIIVVVLLVVLGGGGFMAVKMFMPGLLGGEQPPAAATNGGAPAAPVATAAVPAGPPQMGVLVPLQPFIVNLVDPSGKRYLKLTLSLELNNEQAKPEVDTRLPQVRDAVLLLLSSLTFDDIRTVEGKMRLRQQIISRCNTFLATGQVTGVYFSEFVVQ